jgi:hypothetical protein
MNTLGGASEQVEVEPRTCSGRTNDEGLQPNRYQRRGNLDPQSRPRPGKLKFQRTE